MVTDLKKYKRLFAFGCSFTSYIYPTWADILHKSMSPDTKFYNFGKSGGGNMFIAARISEANNKFKFNEDDLVVVMWSTFARIDFYKTTNWEQPSGHKIKGWITPGNIYTQEQLSRNTVRELDDFNFFLIRDLAIIDVATGYLNNLPCDSLKLMAVPFDYETYMNNVEEDELHYTVTNTYENLVQSYPRTLYDFMDRKWSDKIKYNDTQNNKSVFVDYHPTPMDYFNYLQSHNVPLNEDSYTYAHESTEYLKNPNNTRLEIINYFKECDGRIDESYRLLW